MLRARFLHFRFQHEGRVTSAHIQQSGGFPPLSSTTVGHGPERTRLQCFLILFEWTVQTFTHSANLSDNSADARLNTRASPAIASVCLYMDIALLSALTIGGLTD